MTNSLPRGIRNNNPLNLRISDNQWLGKVKNNTDGAFEQFTSLEYGIRAGFKNIQTILRRRANKGQSTTVRELVHIWAPAADGNNEFTYWKTIADKTGLQPDDIIDIKKKNFMCLLVYGMVCVENGRDISMLKIESGYHLAFGKPNGLQNQPTNTDGNKQD